MEVKAEGRPPVQGPEHRKKIYSRIADRALQVRDARTEIGRASRRSHGASDDLRAFLESKREMIRSHARLTPAEKTRALAEIDSMDAGVGSRSPEPAEAGDAGGGEGGEDEPPLPGGVGFGVFYDAAYKMEFDTGTAVEFSIICPTRAGGNVDTYLYLTAMNRASLGAEAFVAYQGQEELRFVVFDWARTDHWQIDLPFSSLRSYLHELALSDATYQALHALNFTYHSGNGVWANEVYLRSASTDGLDLIYAYDYPSATQDQKAGWTGSWGPIVETFQNLCRGTNELGFANFCVAACVDTEWEGWQELSPPETSVRQDGVGFQMIHLEPNHTFIAAS